jgi:hypothetical protein
MRTATGQSEPDIDLLRELEERMKRFRIESSANSPDIVIEGNAYQGYAVNTPGCGELGSAPPPNPGACCLPDGTCESVTPGQCLLDGGTFSGGSCDDVVCTGACCADDGTCTDTTEDDCVGRFQGIGTSCADDPPPCPTGACCDDEGGCTITTEEGCTGTYQGDDTVCDPNPCEAMPPCDCGFVGFVDSGTQFLTRTTHYVWTENRGAPFEPCTSSFDQTTTETYDPDTCEITTTCSGGGNHTGDFDVDFSWNWVSDGMGGCHCGPTTPGGHVCTSCNNGCGGVCDTFDPDTNTVQHCTCHASSTGFTSDVEITVTLSDQCTPSGFDAPP